MAAQELDDVEGDALIPQEGRHAVAVAVRVNVLVDARRSCDRLDDLLDAARRERRRAITLKERSTGAITEVEPELLGEIRGEQYHAILPAFARPDPKRPLGEVHVGHLHVHDFADPQAGLEEGAVDAPFPVG